MKKWISAFAFILCTTPAVFAAPQCTLINRYENSTVPVFRTSDGLVTFKTNVDVNTDGALQSYKIDDLGFFLPTGRLQTNSALNTICNGVNIRRPNHAKLFGAGQCRQLERFPKRLNRDSLRGANMIQAAYWQEASMDGEAIFGGLA
jgi:hypothetical protein